MTIIQQLSSGAGDMGRRREEVTQWGCGLAQDESAHVSSAMRAPLPIYWGSLCKSFKSDGRSIAWMEVVDLSAFSASTSLRWQMWARTLHIPTTTKCDLSVTPLITCKPWFSAFVPCAQRNMWEGRFFLLVSVGEDYFSPLKISILPTLCSEWMISHIGLCWKCIFVFLLRKACSRKWDRIDILLQSCCL